MVGDTACLRQALDTLDDVFYVYDSTDGLVYWNRRLEDLFDLTEAELTGMNPTEFSSRRTGRRSRRQWPISTRRARQSSKRSPGPRRGVSGSN
ncbi:PAS domain-containing protein [Halomicroarcula sp. GCM10025709]|uniref:PAS domain-containing protein n=1 Tax=Halomicroarcula sp. GCM10025709 TaxID=3252669 RepID=UPI00360BBC80